MSQGAESKPTDDYFFDIETYYKPFRDDCINAHSEIIISSPYVSSAGVERLIRDGLCSDDERVSIKLITFPPAHYSEDIKLIIEALHNKLVTAGIEIRYAEHIPSKYAVIDKEIIWYGSMNLVSTIKEDDDEMRIVNKDVAYSLIKE